MKNLPLDPKKKMKILLPSGFSFDLNMDVLMGKFGTSPFAELLWATV